MRMERYLRRKRKWKMIRLLVAYQLMFTLILLYLTSASYALLTEQEQVPVGVFSTAFVFEKTVDTLSNQANEAKKEASVREKRAAALVIACKEADFAAAEDKVEDLQRAVSLAEHPADEARMAIDELAGYFRQAELEVEEAKEEVKKRLEKDIQKNGDSLDRKQLQNLIQMDPDVQAKENLYTTIKQALNDAENDLEKIEKHADQIMKSARKCEEAIIKKDRDREKKEQGSSTKQRQSKNKSSTIPNEDTSSHDREGHKDQHKKAAEEPMIEPENEDKITEKDSINDEESTITENDINDKDNKSAEDSTTAEDNTAEETENDMNHEENATGEGEQ